MAYPINPPTLGVDFSKEYTDLEAAPFPLGKIVDGSDGTSYMFVKFSAAKSKGYAYIIGDNFELSTGISTSGASIAPVALGVPQIAFDGPDSGISFAFGWVAVKGPMVLYDVYEPAADVELTTHSLVAGLLNTGGKVVDGLKFTEATLGASQYRNAFTHLQLGVRTDA